MSDPPAADLAFETLNVRQEGGVVFVEIAAPPMNLLGPGLVRDLVSLIERTEADGAARVLVFTSADPDYFIAHVDVGRIAEYRAEAAKLVGEPSIGLLFRRLSTSRLVSIAQIEGRVRAAGSELVLACDMRFAARESAIFAQPEVGLGAVPGAGGMQHLTRLLGRGRALEVILSADDYDAAMQRCRPDLTETIKSKHANPATNSDFDLHANVDDVLPEVGMSTVDSGGSLSFYGCDPIVPAAHRFGSTSAIGMAAKPLLLRRRGGKTDAVRRVPRCDRPGCDGQDARLVQNRACAARLEQA